MPIPRVHLQVFSPEVLGICSSTFHSKFLLTGPKCQLFTATQHRSHRASFWSRQTGSPMGCLKPGYLLSVPFLRAIPTWGTAQSSVTTPSIGGHPGSGFYFLRQLATGSLCESLSGGDVKAGVSKKRCCQRTSYLFLPHTHVFTSCHCLLLGTHLSPSGVRLSLCGTVHTRSHSPQAVPANEWAWGRS